MLEGVLSTLLNKYAGDFIDGLDPEQLKLGVFGGEINLTDLHIKPSALDFLHLPVGIRSGQIGRLKIKLHWLHLFSQSVEVTVEDVFVVACNKDLTRIDEAAEAERALQSKLTSLNTVEAFKLSEAYQNALHGKHKTHSTKQGYIASLISTIVDNIQISIKNVHIRFEHDGLTNSTHPTGERSALGIILRSFKVNSTDERGNERFVPSGATTNPDRNLTYKKVDLTGLSVYFNTSRTGSGTQPMTAEAMKSFFNEPLNEAKCDYLLKPLHGTVKLEMNKLEPAKGQPPGMTVGLKLQSFEFCLDEVQYYCLLSAIGSITRATSTDRIIFQRYVDLFRVGSDDERERYLQLYRRTIAPSWEPHLDSDEVDEMQRLEKELTHETIATWRSMVFALLAHQLPQRILSKRKTTELPTTAPPPGFVSKWMGSAVYVAKSIVGLGSDQLPKPDVELTDHEIETICQSVLDGTTIEPTPASATIDELDDSVEPLPNSYVNMAVSVEQSLLSFALLSKARRPLTTFSIHQTRCRFEQRKKGMLVGVTIGNICLADQTTPNTLYPDVFSMSRYQREKLNQLALVSGSPVPGRSSNETPSSPTPKSPLRTALSPGPPSLSTNIPSTVAPFIDLIYETSPSDELVDTRIIGQIQPSLLIVHQKFISRIQAFFAQPQEQQSIDIIKSWGLSNLQQVKQTTAINSAVVPTGDIFKSHSAMSLQVFMAVPTILVTAHPNILQSPVLVLDPGILSIKSRPQTPEVIAMLKETIAIRSAVQQQTPPSLSPDATTSSTADLDTLSTKPTHPLRSPSPHSSVEPLLTPQEIDQCYDLLDIRVQDIQLFFSLTSSAMGGRGFDSKTYSTILSPMSLNTGVHMSIAPDMNWLSTMRVIGEIGAVDLEFTKTNFHKLMQLVNSFTMAPPPTASPVPPMTTDTSLTAATSSSSTSPESGRKGSITTADAPPSSISPTRHYSQVEPSVTVNYANLIDGSPHDADAAGGLDDEPFSPHIPHLSEKEFLTLQDLTELFQSEKEARALLAEVDVDGDGEVSRQEYDIWYTKKKHILKYKKSMELEFRVGQIRIKLIEDQPGVSWLQDAGDKYPGPKDVMILSISDVLFAQSSKSFSSRMNVEVGDFQLTDCLTPYPLEFKSIISSSLPRNTPNRFVQRSKFLNVIMDTTSAEHPDFLTSNMIAQDLKVDVGNFIVLVDPHALNRSVMWLLKEFLPRKEQQELNALPPTTLDTTPTVHKSPSPDPLAPVVPVIATMRVQVAIGLLQLLLTQRGSYLTKFACQSVAVDFSMFPEGMMVKAGINKLALIDLRHGQHLPVLVGIEPFDSSKQVSPLLQCSYTQFSPLAAKQFGFATHVDVSLQSVKLIHDFYFDGAVLNYLWMTLALPFIAGDSSQHVAAQVAEAVEEKVDAMIADVQAASPTLPFLKFTVVLDDIELVLPNHKTKDPSHKLTVHLRQVDVCNNVLRIESVHRPGARPRIIEYQQYLVGIGGLSLLSSYVPGSEPQSRAATLIHFHQLCVSTNMMQAINNTLDVRIEAGRMDISLAQENYVFLMDMVWAITENLQGLWAPPEGEDQAPKPDSASSQAMVPVAATPSSVGASSVAGGVASSPPAAPSNWIKVGVLLHDCSIQLLKNKGWNSTDSLITLLGRSADIRYVMDSTGVGGMSVEMGWEAMEILDDSIKTNTDPKKPAVQTLPEYRRMFGIRDYNTRMISQRYKTAHQSARGTIRKSDLTQLASAHLLPSSRPSGTLYVKWFKNVAGAQEIDVHLGQMYMCLCSMVLMELTTFFYIPPKPEDVAAAELASKQKALELQDQRRESRLLYGRGRDDDSSLALMADALVTGTFVPNLPPSPPPFVMSIKLRMPSTVIQLVSSTSKSRARNLNLAFDLAVEFGMGDKRMNTSVQLNQCRALESITPIAAKGISLITDAEKAGQEYIMKPSDIHVAFLNEPSQLFMGHSNMTIDVGIEQMCLNVGYQQFQVIMGALSVLYPPTQQIQPTPTTTEVIAASPKSKTGSPSSSSASASPSANSPVAATPPSPLHFSEQNIHVQVGQLEVNLINDCYHNSMYLLRLQLSHLLSKVHKFGDSGGIYARFDLNADFHNHRVMCWEPLLENWDLIATQHSSLNTKTPQEYLLLNQPNKKHHQITQDLASETDESMSDGTVDEDGGDDDVDSNAPPSPSSSFANTDKNMSVEEITTALTPFTTLNLMSSKPFNINLSVAAITDIIDFLALIKDAPLKSVPDTKFYVSPPYRVENHTNLDLELYLTRENRALKRASLERDNSNPLQSMRNISQRAMSAVGMALDELSPSPPPKVYSPSTLEALKALSGDIIRVPAYSEYDLVFPDYIAASERAMVVKFMPEQLGFSEFTLPVSKNQSIRSLLTPQNVTDDTTIITDISVKNGVRVISIHSNLCVGNETDGEIAVRTTLLTEHIVPRGKLFWLPLLDPTKQRRVKVRPYEAVEEEGDASLVGEERMIESIDPSILERDSLSPIHSGLRSPHSSTSPLLPSSSDIGLMEVDALVDPLHKTNILPPTDLSEQPAAHHWSGELVCNAKEHRERKSGATDAMHYRCLKTNKDGHEKPVVQATLFHQPSLSPTSIALAKQAEAAREELAHVPHTVYDSPGTPEIETDAYNFVVYAAVWKKKEVKAQVQESQQLQRTDTNNSEAEALAAEMSDDQLAKKKYCSIYYIRNPLTIENFLASKVQLRLYNNSHAVDEDAELVESALTLDSPINKPVSPTVNSTGGSSAKLQTDGSQSNLSETPSTHPIGGHAKTDSTSMRLLKSAGRIVEGVIKSDEKDSPPRLVEEITLDRGQAFPSHAISTHVQTFLSIKLPQLDTSWSPIIKLPLSHEPKLIKFHLQDHSVTIQPKSSTSSSHDDDPTPESQPGSLTIMAEVSLVQGHVHVLLYTHYWIFDMTHLGLMLMNDETKQSLPRLSGEWLDVPEGAAADSDHSLLARSKHSASNRFLLEDEERKETDPSNTNQTKQPGSPRSRNSQASQDDHEVDMDYASIERAAHEDAERLMKLEQEKFDTHEPIMFSSRHHDPKKQRIRLMAGLLMKENIKTDEAWKSHGRLKSDVQHNLLGPTNEPPNVKPSKVLWSEFSDPISMEHVGTTESVTIPTRLEKDIKLTPAGTVDKDSDKNGRLFELICNVATGPGRFFRTKQVTFAPRYILVNNLNTPVRLKQFYGKSSPPYDPTISQMTIDASTTEIFHWPHALRQDRRWLSVQRVGPKYDGWNWSGYVDVTAPGDFPMVVTHTHSHQSWFLNIEIRLGQHGSSFIIIDELKNQDMLDHLAIELPYLIQNRSTTQTIRFRQVRDKLELSSRYQQLPQVKTSTLALLSSSPAPEISPYDWFEVPPGGGLMPYIWEEPLQAHEIAVQFSVLSSRSGKIVDWQKEKTIVLDDADEKDSITLKYRMDPLTSASSSSSSIMGHSGDVKETKIYYFKEQSGPTQILVFADRPKTRSKGLLGLVGGRSATPSNADPKAKMVGDDSHLKEIPDDSGPARFDRKFGSPKDDEPDGGLPVLDPAEQTEEERKVQADLLGSDAEGYSRQSTKRLTGSSQISSPKRSIPPKPIPIDFTSAGVLEITVKEATGFKSSRHRMFAGVVFNDMIQRTDIQVDTREPKWNRRMTFRTDIDSQEFAPTSCFCCHSSVIGTDAYAKQNKQMLYVNIYEKTRFSDHFLGCAMINLREIGFDHADKWFAVVKQKGGKRGLEKRGQVHLGIWWQQEGMANTGAQIQEEKQVSQDALDPNQRLLMCDELREHTPDQPGGPRHIGPPRLHRLCTNPDHVNHLRELVRLTQPSAYQECDRSMDSVWSEYRIRILTTALMKELGASHQLDFLQGRLVAYITCPLIPRGFSVLLMDHGIHNMVKRWKQDIHFCFPHFQATRHRPDAIVRITIFFYKSKNYHAHVPDEDEHKSHSPAVSPHQSSRSVSATAPSPRSVSRTAASRIKADRPTRPISGFVEDLYTEPIRIGECLFDLMQVREMNDPTGKDRANSNEDDTEEKDALDEEQKQNEADAHAEELADGEEDAVAHASTRQLSKQQDKKKSKKKLKEEAQERQRKEWQAKWIPIVSSLGVNVSASSSSSNSSSISDDNVAHIHQPSLCLNVRRFVRERTKVYKPTTTAIKVYFPLFGMSLIDSSPEEVSYISLAGVSCNINDSNYQTTLSASIASFQVDNLLRGSTFPVVFNPTIIQGDTPVQPWLQVALNKKKAPHLPRMLIMPYFSLLIQKMDIRVEEVMIWRTLAFVNQMAVRLGGESDDRDLDRKLLTRRFSEHILVPTIGTQRMYFKLLHVQPIAINVSFSSSPGQRHHSNQYHINPFYTVLHMLEAGIGNINDAPLRLNGKLIENAVGTSDTIVWSLIQHYITQGVMEGYKIFGSVEFLGNPVGVASALGTGTFDFFSEPAKGLMISPEAFGTGLAKGSSSLVKSTIGGLFGAASSVTNSASKAMATASGDEAFMQNQAAARNQKQPEHLGQGLVMGAQALGSSLVSGVTGIFLDPLAGAKKEGLLGFGKGLAKGLAGVVFKPIAGVLDLTTNTLKGISNTANYLLDGPLKELKPFRPKRWIDPHQGIVHPYDLQTSLAHDQLWKTEQKLQEKNKKANEKQPTNGKQPTPTKPTANSTPSATPTTTTTSVTVHL